MAVAATSIPGLYVIRSPRIDDRRGFFRQTYQMGELAAALGREPQLRQGNHSRSVAGTLRGLHAEPWDKLVQVVRGTAFCVVADVRPDSPTFARSESFLLGDAPGEFLRLFVGAGLANGFCCLSETDYINDVSAEFDPRRRTGIAWNDPTLAIAWPRKAPLLSATDAALPTLRESFPRHPLFAT